jgi:hypothetical protein
MNNLARIVSHGFAIMVVILLGLGFIYRGDLFPNLELPDFLVPESQKVAGQQGLEQPQSAPAGEAAEATPPVAGAQSVPAAEPPSEASRKESANPPSEPATSHEVAPSEMAAGTMGEPRRPPAEVLSPPAKEGAGPGEGATGAIGEVAPGTAEVNRVPVPAPTTETPTGSQARASGSEVQRTLVPHPAKPSSEPPSAESWTPGESSLPPGTSAPATRGELSRIAVPSEGPSSPEGAAAPGIAPVPSAGTPTGGTTARQPSGRASAQVKPNELLAAAREAFWLHKYEDAEKNYRALTELEPQNPDGYGELGNMYFSQGRWEEAAAAYYEAGVRLVREGRLEPARELVNVIRGLNGKQADDLEKLISSASGSADHR